VLLTADLLGVTAAMRQRVGARWASVPRVDTRHCRKNPVVETLTGPAYQRIYGKAELDRLTERNQCPENERLCGQAVWLTQTMLLGPRSDMDQIADAVRKVQRHAADLRSL
jgi:hypothetical protein